MADSVIDSCCVINLYAAADLHTVVPPLAHRFHVPAQVLDETQYIRQPDPADPGNLVRRKVELTPALDAGLLHRCDLDGPEELGLFVQFAATLDDGEAACLAIAKVRGWTLATDDRKGRREAAGLGVPVVTTPELLKTWADATQADAAAVAGLLRNVQEFARFVPHHTMPLHAWWIKMLAKLGN
jgi:hypothetical protein